MTSPVPESVRPLIGRKRVRQHRVSEGEIVRFAQAVGEPAFDQLGRPEAPLLFCQALAYEAVPLEELPPDGSPRELHVPIPNARTVGGSSEYVVHRRVRAGELVTIESSVKDVYSKQGKRGELFMVVVETLFRDEDERPIASEIATYIKQV